MIDYIEKITKQYLTGISKILEDTKVLKKEKDETKPFYYTIL